VWGIFGPILGSEACDVTIIPLFDPLGGQVKACSNRNLKVWELCVFDISIWHLVIGFLIFGHLVSKAFDLLTKFVLHLPVDCFAGFDSFEQAITDRSQGDSINVFPDGVEGCGNCARGEWLAT
jgi:hypothetical protein